MTILAAGSGFFSAAGSTSDRVQKRELAGLLGAITAILLANLQMAGAEPIPMLLFSGCMVVAAIASTALAQPRSLSVSMAAAPLALLIWTLAGWFGPIVTAGPDVAVLLAAMAAWSIGYISARTRTTQRLLWSSLVWSLLLYCVWAFFTQISTSLNAAADPPFTAGLGSTTDAAVLFGFVALIGSARVMHVVKEIDAAALSRAEMIDRLMRDGLGAILLVGFAFTCLSLTGSRIGVLLASSAIVFHSWWDLGEILRRDHRSSWVRVLERLAPVASLAGVALALFLAFFHDESVAPNTPGAAETTHIQRLETYWTAAQQAPLFGHGLDEIDTVADRAADLHSYVALTAPGDARNAALNWLVETGYAGLAFAAFVLLFAHVMIIRVLLQRKAPRSLPRLAIMGSGFLLLHGVADSSLAIPALTWTYALILGCACGVAAVHHRKKQSPAT